MSELSISFSSVFFNTEYLEDSSRLIRWSNFCFAPTRYIFNGRSVLVERDRVLQVPSFHAKGSAPLQSKFMAKAGYQLESNEVDGWLALAFAVTFVFGLFFGFVLRSLAYIFYYSEMKERHDFVKHQLTPVNRFLGNSAPIGSQEDLNKALNDILQNEPSRPTHALIIQGNGSFRIDGPLENLSQLDPNRIILIGLEIQTHPIDDGNAQANTFHSQLHSDPSWHYGQNIAIDRCATLDEALGKEQPKRNWTETFKTVHMVTAPVLRAS